MSTPCVTPSSLERHLPLMPFEEHESQPAVCLASKPLTDSRQQLVLSSMVSSGFWEGSGSLSRSRTDDSSSPESWRDEAHDPLTVSNHGPRGTKLVRAKTEQDFAQVFPQPGRRLTQHAQDPTTAKYPRWLFGTNSLTEMPPTRKTRLCSSEDSSDSDEDSMEWLDHVGEEPKTRFEAALRRARLADRRRKLLTSAKSTILTGRSRPDCGSPVQQERLSQTCNDIAECHAKPSDNCTIDHDWEIQLSPIQRSDSPEQPSGTDLCTGIEAWLNSRPRQLYEPQKVQTLQLCFISASEQDLFNPACSPLTDCVSSGEMAVSDPIMEPTASIGFIGENCAQDIFLESDEAADVVSQVTDLSTSNADEGTSDLVSLFPSRANRTGLLREQDDHEDLWQGLNELDRFCGLYLEQLLQDCVDEQTEVTLTKHLEQHQKLRVTAEMALTQLPKVAHMQAEVEHYMWMIPSLPVAKLLKISPKPRTFISVSTLNRFSLYQLQLLMNDLHSSVHNLNSDLLQHLAERDELHSELGRKCSEVGHLATHFKDLCIGLSVSRFRRQLSSPAEKPQPDVSSPFAQVTRRLTSCENPSTRSRLFRSLFTRRSTKF